jgi:hypothetical protein
MKSSQLRSVAFAFGLQYVAYLNIAINMRALAHGQYLAAGTTAALAALLAYSIVKVVQHEERGHMALFGMMLGGFCADVSGIWLTQGWH